VGFFSHEHCSAPILAARTLEPSEDDEITAYDEPKNKGIHDWVKLGLPWD